MAQVQDNSLNTIYLGGLSSVLHAIIVPLFTYLFVIIYQPFDMTSNLAIGTFPFIAHLSILYSIYTVAMVIVRLLLFLLRRRISASKTIYAGWCLGEVVFSSFLMSIYVSLAMSGETPFFSVARNVLGVVFSIAIFAYVLLFFCLDIYGRHKEAEADKAEEKASLIRFYDEYHKLRLIIASSAIVYIKSEDNYLQIYYMDQQKLKRQMLRSSMRAQEDLLLKHGLLRCHRSFFVNPEYIQVLHRDTNGSLVAELNQQGCEAIPVSRKYKDAMTSLL